MFNQQMIDFRSESKKSYDRSLRELRSQNTSKLGTLNKQKNKVDKIKVANLNKRIRGDNSLKNLGEYGKLEGEKGNREDKTPSEIAKSWQGSGKYPGVDKYKDIMLKAGKTVYRGEPNGTEYFTTKSAILRSGNDATKIFEGLQVEKNPIHGYRGTMQGYKVVKDINAAFGMIKANPQFGQGGLPQIFIPNVEELIKQGFLVSVDNIPLIK